MTNKSRIYQELTKQEVQKIVTGAFDSNTKLKSFDPLKGGMFNTCYLLDIVNPKKEVVLRVEPIRKELLFDFEINMMLAESSNYEILRMHGIPVPSVIKCDDSLSIIPRTYILMEYVEGIPLNHPSFPQECSNQIRYELGYYTAKIHSIKSDLFGWTNANNYVIGYKKWSEFIYELTQEIVEKATKNEIFETQYIQQFNDFFSKYLEVFNGDFIPSLVHGDLWDPNIIVKNEGENWHISAIIDADRALYAEPEFEYILWGNEACFMKGYSKELNMTKEGILRRKAYMLIYAFMNVYANKVQFDNLEDYIESKQWAINTLREINNEILPQL